MAWLVLLLATAFVAARLHDLFEGETLLADL